MVGADQTCNEDPVVSSVWGHCEAGLCLCNAGTERNPATGKCRASQDSACYSPTQNLDSAYRAGATGCACDPSVDEETCRADSSGKLVALTCNVGTWRAVEDGACGLEAATITLQRSLCFGGCPAYKVTLNPDGLVSYEGEAYVLYHGAASHHIDPSAVRSLAEELENAHYFALTVPQDCTQWASDAPTITTSLKRYGRSHEIENYHGNGCAPFVLPTLERRIDEVAETSVWVTCPPDDYCHEP
jgi:hypothetical protein